MNDWEIAKLILFYTFLYSTTFFIFLAIIFRVILDYITFFSSFRTETQNIQLQRYISEALSYKGPFKDRVMAKALLRMAREIDLLKEKSK